MEINNIIYVCLICVSSEWWQNERTKYWDVQRRIKTTTVLYQYWCFGCDSKNVHQIHFGCTRTTCITQCLCHIDDNKCRWPSPRWTQDFETCSSNRARNLAIIIISRFNFWAKIFSFSEKIDLAKSKNKTVVNLSSNFGLLFDMTLTSKFQVLFF